VPEIHLPHLEEEAEGEAETHPAPSKTSRRWKSALKIGLEVLLITSVERVHDRHVKERKDLEAYFAAHGNELNAHLVDPRKPIPGPVPDNVTDSAGFDYSAWDLALATQSLSYIDPDLVASMSAAYRMQQMYEDAHRAIAQTSYSFTDPVYWLRGVTNYFGDAALWEELLLKRYDDLLPRLDRALGESPATGNVVK